WVEYRLSACERQRNSVAKTCTAFGPTRKSRRRGRLSIFTTSPTRTATGSPPPRWGCLRICRTKCVISAASNSWGGTRLSPATMGLPPDMPDEVRNLVSFKVVGGNKTELTVTEYDWPVGQMMEMSRKGMEQCLDKMAASVVET